ncbi:replication-associated recombination protein A [Bacillus cereus]|uniref:replication-associated recombination protein A n=1 Tax=Bacillus cereus TaxID=1396 RepID=UPI0020CE645E|nr:replication-associated recombination protein A [Bacillus cereus]
MTKKMRPLAYRMRPKNINEIIGQQHLLGANRPIRKMVDCEMISSMILYGPPGIGKSTIALAIANNCNMIFRSLNAVSSSKKDLEAVGKLAANSESSILLYIDEIHRFSRTQLEYLLPLMEAGDIIVIGATTESVFHSLPSAILSRCSIFELHPLKTEEIHEGLIRALKDTENGLGNYNIEYSPDTLLFLAETTGGDLRSALNILETIIITHAIDNKVSLDIQTIEKHINKKHLSYNGTSSKYNLLSALQKSIRGSDTDAALYYLAKLLETGDLNSVHRRLYIISDEDIGLANTNASTHTLTAIKISEQVGLPEARIPLSKIVIELCLSPKSNSAYRALDKALAILKSGHSYEPPLHLQDNHYYGAKEVLGKGEGYLYPHDYPVQNMGGWVDQQYLPDELKGHRFYQPNNVGHEKHFSEIHNAILQQRYTEK